MRFVKYINALLLFMADGMAIVSAIVMAYESREILIGVNDIPLNRYIFFFPFYLPLLLFVYEGLYRYRFDFWQEFKIILYTLFLSLLLVLSYLAITKTVDNFSRYIVVMSFIFMALIIPLQKRIVKRFLFWLGLWKKEAKLLGRDDRLQKSVFNNYYVGYVKSKDNSDTLFIDSKAFSLSFLQVKLREEICKHHEIYFIPTVEDFNLAQSQIFEYFNNSSNLVLLTNRLQSKKNMVLKNVVDRGSAFTIFIITLPLVGLLVVMKKIFEPDIPLFFRQKRLGKDGKVFYILKFQTMYNNSEEILEQFLHNNPRYKIYWQTYKKLPNDPRVTRFGKFLRRFSLDELPQLINVLRGEMSLVGPRPYLEHELDDFDVDKEIILSVKPGITGLWQVLGRNALSFERRVAIDRWYVYNWSLWMDFVIIIKTFKAIMDKKTS